MYQRVRVSSREAAQINSEDEAVQTIESDRVML